MASASRQAFFIFRGEDMLILAQLANVIQAAGLDFVVVLIGFRCGKLCSRHFFQFAQYPASFPFHNNYFMFHHFHR